MSAVGDGRWEGKGAGRAGAQSAGPAEVNCVTSTVFSGRSSWEGKGSSQGGGVGWAWWRGQGGKVAGRREIEKEKADALVAERGVPEQEEGERGGGAESGRRPSLGGKIRTPGDSLTGERLDRLIR